VPSASAAQITNMSRAATSSRFLRQQLQQRLECSRNGGALQLNSRRCYASKAKPEEKEEKESFKGQLYQSTAERLQRDKAEQARFAEHREAQRARSSPPWLVPFGIWFNRVVYMRAVELTLGSLDRRRHRRLLLWQTNPQRPRHFLDHTLVNNHGT
jgi:hypothetical protein